MVDGDGGRRPAAPADAPASSGGGWKRWCFLLAGLAACALAAHAWLELTRIEQEHGGTVNGFLAMLYGHLGRWGAAAVLACPGLLCVLFALQGILRRRR